MAGRLDYTANNMAYWFNLDSFSSEINPGGKPNGLSLSEVVCQYFDFSEETKYCKNCHYSKKFQAYVLPLQNPLGEKNFVFIKGNTVFNPNNFTGFAVGDDISESPYFISEFHNVMENKNWIYFSEPNKVLIDFVMKRHNINPNFQNNYPGQVLHLLSLIPDSWNYSSNNILRISKPSIEDRTILINLLPEEDYIEFGHEIFISLNANNVGLLAKHCITLYSTLQ